MKPVEQTKGGPPDGNCFAACIASVLELELADVPNFVAYGADEWWDRLQDFLRGYGLEMYDFLPADEPEGWHPNGYWLAGVDSLNLGIDPETGEPYRHCVVMHGGTLAWDPQQMPGKKTYEYVELCNVYVMRPFVVHDPAAVRVREGANPS